MKIAAIKRVTLDGTSKTITQICAANSIPLTAPGICQVIIQAANDSGGVQAAGFSVNVGAAADSNCPFFTYAVVGSGNLNDLQFFGSANVAVSVLVNDSGGSLPNWS